MRLKPFLVISLIVLLIMLIPLLNFRALVFNKNYYSEELGKFGVEDKAAANEVIGYLQGENDLPSGFSEKEKTHLLDAKNLINAVIIVFYLLVILTLLLLSVLYFTDKNFWNSFRKICLFSSSAIVIISVALFLLSNHFNFFFTKFHALFFEEESWLFFPTDKIVNLFPQQFFYSFFYKIILNSVLISAGILIISFFIDKKANIFKQKRY